MGTSERSDEAADDLGTLGALDVAACHEGHAKKDTAHVRPEIWC